jgi:formylglycine-generating enzyme required for sulfatase activity
MSHLAEIAKRLHEGRLILFVGAGMSMPYLPSWGGLLGEIFEKFIPKDDPDWAEINALFKDKEYLAIAWALEQRVGSKWRKWVAEERLQKKPANAKERADLQQVLNQYEAIRGLPFASVVTTNFDRYLDPVLPNMLPVPHDKPNEIVKMLRTPRLLKLHGDIADSDSLIFTAEDFRKMKLERPELVFTLEVAARLNSFLFVGYSMQDEDVLRWLERVRHVSRDEDGRHFALVGSKGWGKFKRDLYKELYDVQVVCGVETPDGHADLVRFFGDLRAELARLEAKVVPDEIAVKENLDPWLEEHLYVDPLVEPGNRSLDGVFGEWLQDEKSPFLAVLGEFGTGKTWFSKQARKLAAQILPERTACLVQLGTGHFKHGAGEAEFEQAFGPHFTTSNENGQLVLILDAFDEMARITSETLAQSFERLRFLGKGKAKVVLTCRSELFATSKDEQDKIHADWARKVHVQPFDDARIHLVLQNHENGTKVRAWIDADEGLKELASRPLFLDLLLAADGAAMRPTRNQLFENFVNNVLKRGEKNIDPQRREFAEQLAWRLQKNGARSLPAVEVDLLASEILGPRAAADPAEVLRYRSRALLVRKADEYEFGHLSFQEYLVAGQLAKKLYAGGVCEEIPLSKPIVQFLRENRPMPKQEPIEKDGMVWIPAGPFICGEDDEACVKNLEKGFWMDQYPVTNEQFAAFLASGVKIDTNWFADEKKIRDRKLAKHPVVNVSWYGAKAYADWANKQLPTEEQWEKAARGVDGRAYPWGDTFDKNLCNTDESGKGTTTPVDDYPGGVSPYGCWEMAGNVWEWMENAYSAGSPNKSVRGGSWSDSSDSARCAVRGYGGPGGLSDDLGIRCSRTSP